MNATVRSFAPVQLIAGARCTAVLGPSGSGKSSLLLRLAGIHTDSSRGIESIADRFSLVMQNPERGLFCETVRDEVEFAQRINGQVPATDEAQRWIGMLGLESDLLSASPEHLSGGEKRCVAIACALATRPEVLLLDEPSAGLDPLSRELLHDVLERLINTPDGPSLVLVTHDAEEALRLSSNAVVLRSDEVVWRGETENLLSDSRLCRTLSVPMLPHVEIAESVGRKYGVTPPQTIEAETLEDWVVATVKQGRVADVDAKEGWHQSSEHVQFNGSISIEPANNPVPSLLGAALLIGAAYSANYMVISLGCFIASLVWALFRGERRATAMIMKPILFLAIGMVFLQFFFGGSQDVAIAPWLSTNNGIALPAWRVTQATTMMLVVVAVTSTISAMEIAGSIGRLLPAFGSVRLRKLIVELGFIMGMAIGMMPMILKDIDSLKASIRARGIDSSKLPLSARIKLIPAVIAPLMVGALRRSQMLGEAIYVRGYNPGAKVTQWRSTRIAPGDYVVLAIAILALMAGLMIR